MKSWKMNRLNFLLFRRGYGKIFHKKSVNCQLRSRKLLDMMSKSGSTGLGLEYIWTISPMRLPKPMIGMWRLWIAPCTILLAVWKAGKTLRSCCGRMNGTHTCLHQKKKSLASRVTQLKQWRSIRAKKTICPMTWLLRSCTLKNRRRRSRRKRCRLTSPGLLISALQKMPQALMRQRKTQALRLKRNSGGI